MEDRLDDLDEFMQFRKKIIPELREMLLSGLTDKQILAKFSKHVSARLVTIALTEPDNGKALAAVRDLLDRVNGRATEHKKIEHQMADLTDQQLDALLKSEEASLEGLSKKDVQ